MGTLWSTQVLAGESTESTAATAATAGVRMDAINAENMREYFDLLRSVFDEFDFAQYGQLYWQQTLSSLLLSSLLESATVVLSSI